MHMHNYKLYTYLKSVLSLIAVFDPIGRLGGVHSQWSIRGLDGNCIRLHINLINLRLRSDNLGCLWLSDRFRSGNSCQLWL